jgi:hypothetical protein
MAGGSRPDLLPLAKPVTLGLPYHGKVTGGDPTDPDTPGTLTLPSTATRSITQPKDGGCILVQHPRHAPLSRTAADTAHDAAHDYQWLEYEILSGVTHQLGDVVLGADYHLYCDANYTWLIRIAQTQGYGTCALTVYLSGLFGVFGDAAYTMTERQLATVTWTPVDANGTSMTDKYVGGRAIRTYSKAGDKVVMNVGTYFQSAGASTLTGLAAFNIQHQTYSGSVYVHDIVRITISGNGSIVAGSVGTGISASISRTAAGRYRTTATDTSLVANETYSGLNDTFYTTTVTEEGYYVVLPGGTEAHYLMEQIETGSYVCTFAESIEGGWACRNMDVTWDADQTASFGANSYTGSASYVGTWEYLRNPNNLGTLTHNGVEESWQSGTGAAVADAPDPSEPSFGVELPLVTTFWPPGLDLLVWFADGKTEQEIAEADLEKHWAYHPGTQAFAMEDDAVSYV